MSDVIVHLDRPRRLKFDLRASKALDRVMGEVGMQEIMRKLQALNFQALERVLWAGTLHEDPTVTVNLIAKRLEQVEAEGRSFAPLFVSAVEALDQSGLFKTEDDSGNGEPKPIL
jgi:hypothetical protein